jgi:teichuronic acid biosynthesis glycosyltransferase TuaC
MTSCENLTVPTESAISAGPVLPQARGEKQLHVLTLAPFYPREEDEGSGCFIAEPLRELEKWGVRHSVIVAAPFYRRKSAIAGTVVPASSSRYFAIPKGFGLASSGAFLYRSVASSLRGLHARAHIDLIHAHGALPCGHAASLLFREFGIPYVVSVHGLDAYSTNQVKGLAGRWCERVSSMTYKAARSVICVSEHVRDQVNKGGDFTIDVVYNGVDTKVFRPAEVARSTRPLILSVGDLIPSKGHDVLLRAVAALRSEFPRLVCEIVGNGRERDKLTQLARDLGIDDRVSFLGRLSRRQVAERMQHCSVFALPSSYEALGCVYLEAMACGKPVVGCRGQGIEEIVQSDTNGFLVDQCDVRGLTDVLSRLLRGPDLRRQIAAQAHRTVHQCLTIRQQAENLSRIYTESAR